MTFKIFIGNLSSDTTSDKLRPLFEKYGEVVECDVLKNFGFVHMTNKNDANKAIAQLDGYSIDGNNIRVELSTGKRGGENSGKFDRRGFSGGPGGRPRPYGPGPGRGGPRDFERDRYPFPPVPPAYDRYDQYYRYYMDREAYYSRLGPLAADRAAAAVRDRFPPLPRDRLAERFPPDPRDRLMPPRSYLEDRARALPADPYLRERDPLAARPPPEYYDRKPSRLEPPVSLSASAAASRGLGSSPYGNGLGDYYRGLDRPSSGGLGGPGAGGAAGDYYRQAAGGQSSYGRPGLSGGLSGKSADSQSSFAQDAIFF